MKCGLYVFVKLEFAYAGYRKPCSLLYLAKKIKRLEQSVESGGMSFIKGDWEIELEKCVGYAGLHNLHNSKVMLREGFTAKDITTFTSHCVKQ